MYVWGGGGGGGREGGGVGRVVCVLEKGRGGQMCVCVRARTHACMPMFVCAHSHLYGDGQ